MTITEEKIEGIINNADLDKSLIESLSEISESKSILACFQCGMCTSSCPIVEEFPLNPHQLTKIAAIGAKEKILDDNVLRYCLTCRTCQEYCPQDVNFIEFIKAARSLLVKKGLKYDESHHGILTLINELQAKQPSGMIIPPDLIPDGFQSSKNGKIAYFFGCLPILDTVFKNLKINLQQIAKDAIKIMSNILDQPPIILGNMKCCGHDALWKGHFETFKKLALYNVREINKQGIETIITTCAECYRTLKIDYPKYIPDVKFNVIHLTELIADKIGKDQFQFQESTKRVVTYHDPCRLGRHMKVYSPPRIILNSMKEHGVGFNEMSRSKENSVCCGVSCFINCNDLSKALQFDRLKEAENVADLLVTTCPKCQIHYNCMLQEKKKNISEELKLEISDITNLTANMMSVTRKKKAKKKKESMLSPT